MRVTAKPGQYVWVSTHSEVRFLAKYRGYNTATDMVEFADHPPAPRSNVKSITRARGIYSNGPYPPAQEEATLPEDAPDLEVN